MALASEFRVGMTERLRRRLVSWLFGVPADSPVAVATVYSSPGDTLVFEVASTLSEDAAGRIRAKLEALFPQRRIAVIHGGVRFRAVVRRAGGFR